MSGVILKVPFIVQTKTSANCGPCSVQSILDYFEIKKADGQNYSTQSINKLIRTTKEYGAEEEDILELFTRVGLHFKKISINQIKEAIERGNPCLAVFEDELHDGHFAVICGYEIDFLNNEIFIFQDPWPDFGEHFKRPFKTFDEQLKKFDYWIMEISKS